MSRLREVQLLTPDEGERRAAHFRLGALVRAFDVDLSVERIEAPFSKLVVRLYPALPVETHGFVAIGVGFADLHDDLLRYDFGTAPQAEVRAKAAELLNRGVDVLRDTVGWDSDVFRAIIDKVTSAVGPWTATFKSAPFDRATRTKFHTVITWDEDSYAVRLEQRDRAGTVLRTWPVTSDPIAFMWVTKTRLVDGRIEFLDSLGYVAMSVDVGAAPPGAAS
jgi:hypothetical protein